MSGNIAAIPAATIIRECLTSGIASDAMARREKAERVKSATTILVVFGVGLPYFSVSVLRCGFQCGILSSKKWLAKAKGNAITGLGILVAIAAPTMT